QQFKLEVGGEEFFIDLLFYHVKLRGFVENDVRMKAEETRRGGCGKCGELAYGDSRQRWRRPKKPWRTGQSAERIGCEQDKLRLHDNRRLIGFEGAALVDVVHAWCQFFD